MNHETCGLAVLAMAVFLGGAAWAKDKETKAPEEATLDQFTMGDVLNGVPFKAEELKGSPAVKGLLGPDPLGGAVPLYARAVRYETAFARSGSWWTRARKGLFFPVVSLKR